jgi:hypothetical protein
VIDPTCHHDFGELYAGTAGWSQKCAHHRHLTVHPPSDEVTGEDYNNPVVCDRIKDRFLEFGTAVVGMGPPCRYWSITSRLTKRAPGVLESLRAPYRAQLNHLFDLFKRQGLLGRYLIVENPWRSAFWRQPEWLRIAEQYRMRYIVLDQCMFGLKYQKRTVIATNLPEWATAHLEAKCSHGKKFHPPLIGSGPGGVPLTRSTAHYPAALCDALALSVSHGAKLVADRRLPHAPPDPHNFWHQSRLATADIAFWRTRIGGLDLDGTQLYPRAAVPRLEPCSEAAPFLQQDIRGRRVFVHCYEHNVLANVEHVLAHSARGSAALLLVPRWPSTVRAKHWKKLLTAFKVLHVYKKGERCLEYFGKHSAHSVRLRLDEDNLLLWLPPVAGHPRTVHSQQLKREQSKLITDRLLARRRVDPILEDLRLESWGKLARPLATDVRWLMEAYPGNDEPYYDDLDHAEHFGITVDADAFAKEHVLHCPFCCPRKSLQKQCYGHRLWHSLKFGWRCPLTSEPPPRVFDNYPSIRTDEARPHVIAKMQELSDYGVLTSPRKLLSPDSSTVPLQAVIRDKDRRAYGERRKVEGDLAKLKVRVCLDMSRNLNDHAPDWKFRYAGLDHVVPLLTDGAYFAIVDLEKFFLQLPTHRDRWRFQCVLDPATKRYRNYRRCPFGFKLTPAFASAVSGEICHMLRRRGVTKVSVFVDDLIIIGATKDECREALAETLRLLSHLGFPVAANKIVQPTQKAEYLGVQIDTVKCQLSISDERQQLLLDEVHSTLARGSAHKKETQRFLGKLNWCSAVMPGARAFMRRLWVFLATLPSRGRRRLTAGSIEDLEWWRARLVDPAWKGSRIWPAEHDLPVETTKSDASGEIGCGFTYGNHVTTHVWSDEQRKRSIAWKELYPILLACEEFGPSWRHKIVRCGIDNAGVCYMLNSGAAAAADCALLLRQIAELESKYDFTIVASWVPREFNVAADTASRNDAALAQVQLLEELRDGLDAALSPPSSRDACHAPPW